MSDFKSMHLKLFNAITDAVRILNTAQSEAEEIYLQHEPDVRLVKPNNDDND